MELPFQVVRTVETIDGYGKPTSYCFELVNTITGAIITTTYGRSPIADKPIRRLQAVLNTRMMLDFGL